jgi:hypothetical protein
MVNWNTSDLMNYESKSVKQPAKVEDGEAKESDLHDKIMAECKRRGWLTVHSRMDRATTNASGVADFIIYADSGRVFTVEAKSTTGKLSTPQMAFMKHLEVLGHKCHAVRSYREFLQLITPQPNGGE